jgi:hypothetical protein
MNSHKLPLSICAGDFYLIGKVGIENLDIKKDNKAYKISFSIGEDDIIRLDDPELKNTAREAKSNVLQIDFNTGEKKWV